MLAWVCASFIRYESATRADRLCLSAKREARLNLLNREAESIRRAVS